LPSVITFTDGNTITYGYDASGQKLSVTHLTATAGIVIPMTNIMTPLAPANIAITTKTDYCGNVIYENGALSKILTEEGYITFSGTTPVYHYYLKDHQGNNRVVINQSGAVQQVNHYYPFGGLFGEGIQTSNQPYKYNGKELDRFQGVDMYDYGARHYDAALGRTTTVDPMAEKYYSFSQYVYCANNPVRFIDPNGMFYHDYSIDQEGYIKKERDTEDKFDRLYTKKDYDKGKEGNVFKLGKEKAKDKTILADLEESRKDFKGSYATSTDKDESFQVFLFSADNTDVEWSISGFGKGKVDRYTVTTSHDDSKVVLGFGINGNNESNMIFTIHSHPSPTGTRGGSLSGGRGDMYNIIRRYDHFIEKGINPIYAPKEYVYHKYGKALYNYTPWNPSIYIRSINSAGDLHRGLGF